MANIANIQNLIACGAVSVIGTGTKGCRPFLKKVSALWLTPAGFQFDNARDLDEEYVAELQAAGNLIVLTGIKAFTDNTPDNSTEELEDGTIQVTRLGKYQFAANFINGFHFNKALASVSGFGDYDTTFVDIDGSVLGTQSLSGRLKGFTTGMIQSDKITWATDTTGQREGVKWQFLERSELDTDYVLIQSSQLDFNPNRVTGINEVELSIPVVPASAATTFAVKAVTSQDGKPFIGAVLANFLVTKNGTTVTPTGVAESPSGTYTFTVAALAVNDVLTVDLYDSVNTVEVITLDTTLFKSKVVSATVVA